MAKQSNNGVVKRSLSAHAAIGLLAGAILYLVSLTGTVAVLHEEFQRLEQPGVPEMQAVSPEVVQRAIEQVLASESDQPTTTHLNIRLPVEARPRLTIWSDHQSVHIDEDGAFAGPEEKAWSGFLLLLHYSLNLPGLIGAGIVGALGVMMLVLTVSGVVAHPKIFRDAFRLRAKTKGGIGLADWHNRLSVWTLPFTIAIALTGAVLGLATATYIGVADSSYGGDLEAVYEPIYGAEGEPDDRPAPIPDVVTALDYMQENFPDVTLTYVVLHDPLTLGQHVQIIGIPVRELIFGEYYSFDAAGQFKGIVGLADGDIGQQATSSTYGLHFGNFGGWAVKLAYVFFGFVLTAICATGVYIWLGKRQRKGFEEPRLLAAWDAVVWGIPLVLCITFIARMVIGNGAPFVAIFWLGSMFPILAAFLVPVPAKHGKWIKRGLILACLIVASLIVRSALSG